MIGNKFLLRQVLISLLCAWLAIAIQTPAYSQSDGQSLALKAQKLYQNGQLASAVKTWDAAAAAFKEQDDLQSYRQSSINQSQVLQDLGLYPRACNTLLQAFEVERPDCSASQIEELHQQLAQQPQLDLVRGIGLRSLGSILQKKGRLNESQKLLQLSIKATQNSSEQASSLLAMGNVQQALGNRVRDLWNYDRITEIIDRQVTSNALTPYLGAFKTYNDLALEPQRLAQTLAQLNHLSLLIDIETWWQQQTTRRIQSWQRLGQTDRIAAADNFLAALIAEIDAERTKLATAIANNLPQLTPNRQIIYAQLNYAKSLTFLGKNAEARAMLQQTLQQAQAIADPLGVSYALGYLGQNYGQQGQLTQAIDLTHQALSLAESLNINGDTREISYLWQSQLGRLLEQSDRPSEAIAAYTLAFNTLQSLRIDLNTNNEVVQFNFRQEVKPVYLRLANLLLAESQPRVGASKSLQAIDTGKAKTNPANPNIELARQVIESLQLAELDNFFQDPCSPTADRTVTIDDLDPRAAVIYPVVLEDRLETILSIAGQPLKHFTIPIAEPIVEQTLDSLYDRLYNQSLNDSAVNIFRTTLLNPREVADNTQALLPSLREIYGWLIEPLAAELDAHQIQTLVFVLNGRLQNVPMAALYDGKQYLLEKYGVAIAPSLQLLNTRALPKNKLKVLAAGLSEQVEIEGEIFPALNNVPEELNRIEAVFPQSRQLLDREFTLANIQQQLDSGFPIVHFATHGVFSSDPEQTFIIMGDRQTIDLKTLSSLLASNPKRPELIVLSACDTATGDERAVLGLAGVAVRSGSSTLASLWSVEDRSTARLMSNFYRQLENPEMTKADALRQAQLALVKSLRANPPSPELKQLPPHPYYWAAYVLVGNWQ